MTTNQKPCDCFPNRRLIPDASGRRRRSDSYNDDVGLCAGYRRIRKGGLVRFAGDVFHCPHLEAFAGVWARIDWFDFPHVIGVHIPEGNVVTSYRAKDRPRPQRTGAPCDETAPQHPAEED